MPIISQLDEMSRAKITSADRNPLVDIKSVEIDTSMPIGERMAHYLDEINDPYCFRCGETPVIVRFSDDGKTLDEAIKDHLLGLKAL